MKVMHINIDNSSRAEDVKSALLALHCNCRNYSSQLAKLVENDLNLMRISVSFFILLLSLDLVD